MAKPKILTVIGGGASGTIFSVHARRLLKAPTEIIVIERSGKFGPGLAYDLDDPCFLLNVRADRMGALEEDHGHFFTWMQQNENVWRALHPDFAKTEYRANDFVPRMIYGAYLKDIFEKPEDSSVCSIKKIHDDVLRIMPEGDGLRIELRNGKSFVSDSIVMASGNSYSRSLKSHAHNVFNSPYHRDFLKTSWRNLNHVVIAGTGLSMVDTVIALIGKGYSGQITAVSRRGLIPLPHLQNPVHGVTPIKIESKQVSVSDLLHDIRVQLKEEGWQDQIDSLRPVSNSLWQGLKADQQKRLMRAAPWWSIARHRIPDFAYRKLVELQKSGALKIVKGEIRHIRENDSKLQIGLSSEKALTADALVNCMGFSYAAENIQEICPQIDFSKHWSGGLKPIAGSGFRISAQQKIYALGPLLFGWNFESTAVHEIRAQAKALVQEMST